MATHDPLWTSGISKSTPLTRGTTTPRYTTPSLLGTAGGGAGEESVFEPCKRGSTGIFGARSGILTEGYTSARPSAETRERGVRQRLALADAAAAVIDVVREIVASLAAARVGALARLRARAAGGADRVETQSPVIVSQTLFLGSFSQSCLQPGPTPPPVPPVPPMPPMPPALCSPPSPPLMPPIPPVPAGWPVVALPVDAGFVMSLPQAPGPKSAPAAPASTRSEA
jgi:hypothetical protein